MNALVHAAAPASAAAVPRTVAHKFGGSSVADAARYRHVAALLRARGEATQVTVVSAMQGVTDALIALADTAVHGAPWQPRWTALRDKHVATARELGADAAWFAAQFEELAALLGALALLGNGAQAALARVHGLGEVWSAHLLGAALRSAAGDLSAPRASPVAAGTGAHDAGAPAVRDEIDVAVASAHGAAGHGTNDVCVLDAREVLVVGRNELGVAVDWEASAARLAAWRGTHPQPRVVATGFVARDARGMPTTLGRNGSDFSGAIFAALFEADELHIWTDVDGVLSADPRAVPEAVLLPRMSYDEACELAYFGAKVIHPQTMAPAIARNTPILIRNTFNPSHPGTRIDAEGGGGTQLPAKGLSLASDLALLNVEGSGMIGVPGTAERVFATLRAAGVSVVMISQGSSEHSICCVVRAAQAESGRAALAKAFAPEIAQGQIQRVTVEADISVLAAVGDGMAGTPGVAARFFGALARARVNVRAIAQGASERNISAAISSADATKALRAAHAGFWLSPQAISLGVIGPGKVGQALIDQIARAAPRLRASSNLDLRLRALASSRRMRLSDSPDGLLGAGTEGAGDLRGLLDTGGAAECDLDAFAAHVHAAHLPHAVIVDCSASPKVAARYAEWLAAGIHVITPNKQAGAGSLQQWRAIRKAAARSGARFRYEATVGAGLPVISTLRDLLDTGDELVAVEGILSGTLAWLFNRYDGTQSFAALVREAHALGYTEPDARDDLSGTDVARKLVILAREAGRELTLDRVQVESLIPEALAQVSPEAFLARLDEFDEALRARHAAAAARGEVLRYVARLDAGGARVGLAALPATHAFAHLQLTDNIVQFSTARYRDNPLIVQGPGAGPDVTAAGVFADLLRVGAALGARL